ncbi:hypothetical protein [Mobiluncus curtisii]|uniref:hypothetical protein n=1 Tax=Mobiluncus curtisii TaxID=2051 RepID=UPI002430D856|nr:hypothetical protein [Mobiluncus curtisii]
MPTTSKRGYPYPNYTGEAPNVPLALEKLATAIDEDFTTVSHSIDTALADSLESRAALLEGRVTTLENRKILKKALVVKDTQINTGIPYDKVISVGMLTCTPGYGQYRWDDDAKFVATGEISHSNIGGILNVSFSSHAREGTYIQESEGAVVEIAYYE